VTHEPELTAAVDLCTPDGRRLNPAARGWSRRPLHRANLRGSWGRNKRWDYWGILSDELVVALTFADIDYLGLVALDWIDPVTHASGGRVSARPLGWRVTVPELVGVGHLGHSGRHLRADLTYGSDATYLSASWTDADGTPGSLDLAVADPPGHESLNVVIPWTDRRFQFTSKHQARPVTGTVTLGDRVVSFGDDAGGAEAWGAFDAGRGRWPYRTTWNWGGGAGRAADGRVVGLQVGGRWTEGTGFTENGVIVDGTLVKVGAELIWDYDWDRPLEPWRVHSPDGALDVTLAPVHDRASRTSAVVLSQEGHQVFGRWTGTVPTPDGGALEVADLIGFAEETRSRW